MDVLTDPWAIVPAKFVEVCEVYNTHLRGDKIDLKALEARLGRPLGQQKATDVVNGKALIPVDGVISKRISLMHDISGGTSTELLQNQISAAIGDPSVREIVLMIDSPGGSVDGVKTLVDTIFEARSQKPITAWIDGMGASAAYWIASAAAKVYIKDATTMVGSIGVVTTHRDVSAAEAQAGVKTTEITAGKYKRIDSNFAPLTEEGKAYIQDRIDAIYTVFVNDVARNRGVDVDTVLSDMADGRVFVGTDAVSNNLVDGVATWEQVIGRTPNRVGAKIAAQETVVVDASDTTLEENMEGITQEQFDAALAEATANGDVAVNSERERIKAILAKSVPGHEALVQTLAFDGVTTPDQAAAKILEAVQQEMEATSIAIVDASPTPIKTSGEATDATDAQEDKLRARWDATASLRDLYGNDYEAYAKADALRVLKTADGTVRAFTKTTTK